MPDSITQELSSAYAQLAELQTKIDEDDLILSILQSHSCGDSARCGSADDENYSARCDGYDLAIEIIVARRRELDRELRKVKENIVGIESKWRG